MPTQVIRRAARAGEADAIYDLAAAAFPLPRAYFEAHLFQEPGATLAQHRLAEVDGRVVSYARVSDRPLRYGLATLSTGGIGAVCTHPQYRGRGLSSAVLADCDAQMRAMGHHVGVLWTPIQGFYARLGWRPFPEHFFSFAIPDPAKVSPPDLPHGAGSAVRRAPPGVAVGPRVPAALATVRPFDEPRDLEAVMGVYEAYNRGRTGSVIRSPAYWRGGNARFLGVLPSHVAERDGRVVAYLSIDPGGRTPFSREKTLFLSEAAGLPGHEDAFLPLAATALGVAAQAGLTQLYARAIPRSSGLIAAFRHLGVLPLEGHLVERMMLRLLDLPALLRAALPELNHLATAATRTPLPPGLSLGFRVDGDYARLALAGGALTVDAAPAAHTLELDVGLFFRLFLGDRPVSDLAEELATIGQLPPPDLLAALDTLFPYREPTYWLADHF